MRLLLALPIFASLATSAYAQDEDTREDTLTCLSEDQLGETISDPDSCTKYYVCERNEEGGGVKPVMHVCPENFQFSLIERRCELDYIVKCDGLGK